MRKAAVDDFSARVEAALALPAPSFLVPGVVALSRKRAGKPMITWAPEAPPVPAADVRASGRPSGYVEGYAAGAQGVVGPSGVPFLLPAPEAMTDNLRRKLLRLYRTICYHSQFEAGHCYARNEHLQKRCRIQSGDSTLRRHVAILERLGWVRSEVRGPQRQLYPLVHPRDVASFWPHFKRLLADVLSVFLPSVPLSHVSEINSNERTAVRRPKQPREPKAALDPEGRAAVVDALQASREEMDAPTAASLVEKFGAQRVRDCARYLAGQLKRGKVISTPGAWLHDCIAKAWKLPGWVYEAEDRAERKAERDRAAANRTQRSNPGDYGDVGRNQVEPPRQQPPPPPEADPLEALATEARDALLRDALREVLGETKSPSIRAIIERGGVGHALVRSRARDMARRQIGGTR